MSTTKESFCSSYSKNVAFIFLFFASCTHIKTAFDRCILIPCDATKKGRPHLARAAICPFSSALILWRAAGLEPIPADIWREAGTALDGSILRAVTQKRFFFHALSLLLHPFIRLDQKRVSFVLTKTPQWTGRGVPTIQASLSSQRVLYKYRRVPPPPPS